jgi:hypothetical protein
MAALTRIHAVLVEDQAWRIRSEFTINDCELGVLRSNSIEKIRAAPMVKKRFMFIEARL